MTDVTEAKAMSVVDQEQRRRNLRAVALLEKWLEEEPPPVAEMPGLHEFIPPPIRFRDVEVPGS